MKLRIYEDKSGEWRWRLRAANGRTIADSGEGYKTKRGVIRAVESLLATYTSLEAAEAIVQALVEAKGGRP
jgi:uncharacterized protein YegP (UPF0339 family)